MINVERNLREMYRHGRISRHCMKSIRGQIRNMNEDEAIEYIKKIAKAKGRAACQKA